MDWYLMVWKKYAEFDGRARRTEYWMFALFNFLAMLALAAVGPVGIVMNRRTTDGVLFIPVRHLHSGELWFRVLAVATRQIPRHGQEWLDAPVIDRAWHYSSSLGFIAAIVQLVFLCTDGQPGPNQYGPNPKFPEQAVGAFAG